MSLEHNDTFKTLDLDLVEELLPLISPDALTYESPYSADERRMPAMMRSSDFVLRVIPEATDLVSGLFFQFFFIAVWRCS